jgi:hypothetical protein
MKLRVFYTVKYHGQYQTAQPDAALRHQRPRVTGTKPHAPRGAAGLGTHPTGTAGHMRATPEPPGAVRSCTTGRGSYRDHLSRAGHISYESMHAHLGTAC